MTGRLSGRALDWGAFLLVSVVVGCTSDAVVPSAAPRPATLPEQVRIYQDEPTHYERLGLIEMPLTAEMKWDEHGEAVAAVDALKARAAALGGNGLLLMVDSPQQAYVATVGYHGTFYQVPMRGEPRRAVAQAIYVMDDPLGLGSE
jgi:hypothetical protein